MSGYNYQTPEDLTLEILRLVDRRYFDKVVDICCGTWNLSRSAMKVFRCNYLCGVDINNKVKQFKPINARFISSSGEIFTSRKRNKCFFDLVLSNPPFEKCEKIIIDKEKRLYTSRKEIYIILGCFDLLKHGGYAVIFVPQTFVCGESNLRIRKYISKRMVIMQLFYLPDYTFSESRVRTCAIVMKKSDIQDDLINYDVIRVRGKWKFLKRKKVSSKCVLNGIWDINEKSNNYKIDDNTSCEIYRGNIKSSDFRKNGKEVLHCSSILINGVWVPGRRRFVNRDNIKKAYKGDIIINRIGKHAGYWSINQLNEIAVSDCILVIHNYSGAVLQTIKNKTIEGKLDIPVRGVAVNYITKKDIERLLFIR